MSKAELKEDVTPSYKSKAGGIATGVEEFRNVSCFSFVKTLPALHSPLLLLLLLFRLPTPQIGEMFSMVPKDQDQSGNQQLETAEQRRSDRIG
jgi:hypothetical protein